MGEVTMHPEAVKAAIRMKHGTIEEFAAVSGVKAQAVRDFLRGTSKRAKSVVADLLEINPDHLIVSRDSTKVELSSTVGSAPHRLNAEAR